jgi:glycosyltransferase involved in cell wall biosynthesis
MDTMGAVIIEAGYYGCPSVAPNQFGIPDLILDRKTGFLIEETDPEIIVRIITEAFSNREFYLRLRSDCYTFYCSTLSWDAIGRKMVDFINTQK